MSFDYSKTYYRPSHNLSDYYCENDAHFFAGEGMIDGDGGKIKLEFESAERVGSWLFLGDQVHVLRIPRQATVTNNRPMSQGGCFSYSADRVQLIETISRDEFLQRLPNGMHSLHLQKWTSKADLIIPASTQMIYLYDSTIFHTLHFPASLERLWLSSTFKLGQTQPPETVDDMNLHNCDLSNVPWPQTVNALEICDCVGSVPSFVRYNSISRDAN